LVILIDEVEQFLVQIMAQGSQFLAEVLECLMAVGEAGEEVGRGEVWDEEGRACDGFGERESGVVLVEVRARVV
jgi:hypothetical protein